MRVTLSWLEKCTAVTGPLMFASLPLSIKVYFSYLNLEVIGPAEFIIALHFLLSASMFLSKAYRSRFRWRVMVDSPLPMLIAAWLAVSALSVLTSTMYVVSAKAFVVHAVYLLVAFVLPLGAPPSRKGQSPLALARWHAWAIAPVVVFALANQYKDGIGRAGAWLAPYPFYIDHTIYSAALVFALFAVTGIALQERASGGARWHTVSLMVLLALGLVLSFGRAAWLSVLLTGGICALWLFPLKLRKWLLLASTAIGLVGAVSILSSSLPASTVHDSNADGAGFKASALSVVNLNSDESNMERLNRWKSALRMFVARPLLGFGPGTFQFAFIPFQRPEEMTYISPRGIVDPHRTQKSWVFSERVFVRRNPQTYYCSGGTAHSEPLLALAESGVFAMLLLGAVLFAGPLLLLRQTCTEPSIASAQWLWAALALTAYAVHALFNNYLDDCKVALPLWSCMLVVAKAWDQMRKPDQ